MVRGRGGIDDGISFISFIHSSFTSIQPPRPAGLLITLHSRGLNNSSKSSQPKIGGGELVNNGTV